VSIPKIDSLLLYRKHGIADSEALDSLAILCEHNSSKPLDELRQLLKQEATKILEQTLNKQNNLMRQ
jgi:hypothetical protein